MVDFKVDTDKLLSAINKYNEQLEELHSIKRSLIDSIRVLRTTGWNSKAGEAALQKFETIWSDDITKYSSYVKFLGSTLNYAKCEFDDLVEKAHTLSKID